MRHDDFQNLVKDLIWSRCFVHLQIFAGLNDFFLGDLGQGWIIWILKVAKI